MNSLLTILKIGISFDKNQPDQSMKQKSQTQI